MTHTADPIDGLTAFEETLAVLHDITTCRSSTTEQRTEAARVLIDGLMRARLIWNLLKLPVVR